MDNLLPSASPVNANIAQPKLAFPEQKMFGVNVSHSLPLQLFSGKSTTMGALKDDLQRTIALLLSWNNFLNHEWTRIHTNKDTCFFKHGQPEVADQTVERIAQQNDRPTG